ncbi:hypothetical protein ACSFA0_14850 [Variovorax sp. LT1P1]|uniref:hypothetical protein n=1 Tax=Variovorax sp. LT1P1 TaxID=3443730 RepID=UPI003F4517CD
MIIRFDFPKVTAIGGTLQGHWLRGTPWGRRVYQYDREVRALETTFLRLVESALLEYDQMEESIRSFWETSTYVNFGAMNAAVSNAEICVTNMHRAARIFNRLLRRPNMNRELCQLLDFRGKAFRTDAVTGRLGDIRNAIHHFEDKLLGGEIGDDEWQSLAPTGPEQPMASEPGQTVKTIDRLCLGPHSVTFGELADWLAEMRQCAVLMAEFVPVPTE